MIVELQLENWKSYERATLHIDALSVLIGTNASGKSNALDALLFLNRIANGALFTSALQGDGVQPALRGGMEWAARKPGDSFAITVLCRHDEMTDYEYRLECKVSDKNCELTAEHLIRRRYKLRQDRARQSNPGVIKLFRTDPCSADAPTITARLYNGKQGSPRQLGRSNCLLFQLVTTHNPALLDAMGPKMVPFITVAHRNSNSGSSVLILLVDIRELPQLLAQGPIGQLSSRGLIDRSLRHENLRFDFEKAS